MHPVIEMASGPDADDHHNLTWSQAAEHGIALELYHRSAELIADD